jgi:Na+/H+-dicarboxylate symporter
MKLLALLLSKCYKSICDIIMCCRISPIGIFFLVAAKMIEMESFDVIVGQLGMYFTTVLLGLFIHGFIVIPLYYSICTRKLPFRFIVNMSQALFTAFGTGSRYDPN